MESYGFLSILPPVIAIILAIKTRQVFVSLFFGVAMGWLILEDGNIWQGFMSTMQAFVDVFKDSGNTRTIMFSALVGGLILLIQKSGGVAGFIEYVEKYLKKYEGESDKKRRRIVQMLAWFIGVVIFVETSISSLTVGTLFRPIFDKLKISREKLAYIADASSASASILIPFNAWGAFIMGLLLVEGFEQPFTTLFKTMPYNFYPILTLIIVPLIIWTGKDFGPMAKAEKRVLEGGKILADGAKPMMGEALTDVEPMPNIPFRMRNMLIPILVMVLAMPFMLTITGWEEAIKINPDSGLMSTVFTAIGKGSGSTSVLISVIFALTSAIILYLVQGIMKFVPMIDMIVEGVSGMIPLALLMLMAFAISGVCKELHTGVYVAEISKSWLSPGLVPAIVFVVSCFIAFSTGTSWGTFAIMIAISVPLAQTMDANVHLAIAAALGGGVFGDHCSPISDTTIISSMASASDHVDHVKTQMPYAFVAGGISFIMYLVLGFI